MRLGLVLEQCLSRIPGGTARYCRELATALPDTAPAGSSVSGWVAAHRDVEAATVDGVDGPHRLVLGARALAVAWERGAGPVPHGVDVVHAPSLLLPPKRSRGLVVTVHDAVPWTHPETLTPRGVSFHRRMGERAARTADVVITPTQAVAAELESYLDLGDRVRVVHHGVPHGLAAPADAAERLTRLGLPPTYAVAVGTLEPRKGLDVAAGALGSPAWPAGVGLVVAGPAGWGDVDVPAGVVATGRLDDADLAAVVAGALCLVAPSRSEGFGLPVLEAMSLGTPVVVSDAAALVEVVGAAGLVVPVGDAVALAEAVRDLHDDPGLHERDAELGRQRAAGFTWAQSAQDHWAAYADAAR